MKLVRRLFAGLVVLACILAAGPGIATAASAAPGGTVVLTKVSEGVTLPSEPVLGRPVPWEIGLQPGYSPVKRDIIWLNNIVLWIIICITLFVGALLAWVMYRYNAKRNPVPTQTVHNTFLEVAWTIIPILILVGIAIPSFKLVYFENRTDHPDMTIKVTGHQWYWEYAYPGAKGLDFISSIVPGAKLTPGEPRLLTASNPLVLPAGKNVRILITSGDVIHSFFIPSLGVQRYAIPGRTIETWVRIDRPGIYYGECNQICGTNHSRMPIDVVAVTPAQFQAWETGAEKQMSAENTPTTPVARQPAVRTAAVTPAALTPAAPQLFAQAQETRR